jgi:hypothetical protein
VPRRDGPDTIYGTLPVRMCLFERRSGSRIDRNWEYHDSLRSVCGMSHFREHSTDLFRDWAVDVFSFTQFSDKLQALSSF